MIMYLLDNGIDSLKMGVRFFEKYLNDEDIVDEKDRESYLKLALSCIHSSVEILTKEVLSQINELIIYSNVSNELLDTLKTKYQYALDTPLYNQLINKDLPVKTINYSEAVEKLKVLLGINNETLKYLKELGYLRNKIMHFGINRELDFYEVIGKVNFGLDFIFEIFYPIYKKITPHPLDSIYHKAMDVLDAGKLAEEDHWGAVHHLNFIKLNELFEKSCLNSNMAHKEQGLQLEFENEGYDDSRSFVIDVADQEGYLSTFSTANIPNLDITLFLNIDQDNGLIYALYDHKEKQFFITQQNIRIQTFMKEKNIAGISNNRKFGRHFKKVALELEVVEQILEDFLTDLDGL